MTEYVKLGGKTFIFDFETSKVFSKYKSTDETTSYRILYESGLEDEIILDNKTISKEIKGKVTVLKLGDRGIIIAPIFDNFKNKFSLFFRGGAVYEVAIIDHLSKNCFHTNNLEKIYKELCTLSGSLGILNPILSILFGILGAILAYQYFHIIVVAIVGFIIGFVFYGLLIWLVDEFYYFLMKDKIHILQSHISKLAKEFIDKNVA